jgi:hypothetical protein
MPLAIPPDLKKISGYIRRAEELDKDMGNPESTLVAYYLRQYAVSEGIPISQNAASSPDTKTCLLSILETLEEQKAKMNTFTPEEAAFLCRQFAAKIFDKADEEGTYLSFFVEDGSSRDDKRYQEAAVSLTQKTHDTRDRSLRSGGPGHQGDRQDLLCGRHLFADSGSIQQ